MQPAPLFSSIVSTDEFINTLQGFFWRPLLEKYMSWLIKSTLETRIIKTGYWPGQTKWQIKDSFQTKMPLITNQETR